jgi:hypothetical protein
MLRLVYGSIRKKDGEMMKQISVNLLKYGLAKHLKETAQIDINIDPVFASLKGVFSAVLTDMKKKKALGQSNISQLFAKRTL